MLVTIAAAYAYTTLRATVWEASQALTVRDEASVSPTDRPGKFHLVEDMKTVQETILELAKSRTVLAAALSEVGPPADRRSQTAWPTDDEVAGFQSAVKLSPPKGAEFGKTEVFYLQTQSNDRRRAVQLASAMSDQLKKRFEDLRDARAQSLVDELNKTVTLAASDLKQTTDKLAKIESEVGSDLGELRILADTAGGDSPLRRSMTDMQSELRGARLANQANRELLQLLENTKNDPHALLFAPTRLLESQPALKRLKDGFVDAQLRTSQLLGSLDPAHPNVLAAKEAESEIARHLHDEAESAIGGLKIELKLTADRCAALESQLASVTERLKRLADIRAAYSNLIAESHRRTETVRAAESQLAEARATEAGAHTANLISRIDAPEAGSTPIGPTRGTLLLAGAMGGFLLGLGLLLLSAPARAESGDSRAESGDGSRESGVRHAHAVGADGTRAIVLPAIESEGKSMAKSSTAGYPGRNIDTPRDTFASPQRLTSDEKLTLRKALSKIHTETL